MKVCYLINQYPKVSHTFIRREIDALERQGVDVRRVSIRRSGDALVDPDDREELLRTHVLLDQRVQLLLATFRRALHTPGRFARAFALALKLGRSSERGFLRDLAYLVEACLLLEHLRGIGCDHVHAHFGTNPTSVALLCRVLGGPPYSFTAHGPEEFDKPLMLCLRDKIEHAAFVVAISSFGRGQLYRHCDHRQWYKVHVVRCRLPEALLHGKIARLPSRRRVVCVGRLNEQKGHLLLIEAAARLTARGHDLELRLVGDGELRPVIERQITRLGMRGRVHITGWADSEQVRAEIDAARLVVVASFAEGLPVVIMEALAAGRCVLTTAVAGIPELVSSDCGWLVPSGSVDQLTTGLQRALRANDTELERMGRRGQARVRRLHNADNEAAKLRRLFDDSADSTRRAGAARTLRSRLRRIALSGARPAAVSLARRRLTGGPNRPGAAR